MRFLEQLLLRLETSPCDVAYRAVVGFATVAVFVRFRVRSESEWALGVVLLVVFLTLRLVPAVARKALPFSDTAQRVWGERRQLAKRYDSYQWQKLRGIGVGLALYVVISRQVSMPRITITVACLVAGLIGQMRWNAAARQNEATHVSTR